MRRLLLLVLLAPACGFGQSVPMDMAALRQRAFELCQKTYTEPVVVPIPVLDPPQHGTPGEVGLTYQEELSISTTGFLNQNRFYFVPKPRAALNHVPMEVYVDPDGRGLYEHKTWADANPNFSSKTIQPPFSQSDIPEAGRVLTELIVGHSTPTGGWPELFDIRSSAYVRFCGFSPQANGATLRLGAHGIFGLDGHGEDFPSIREIYASTVDTKTARTLVLIESRLFCGALSLDMIPAQNSDIVVDGYWYTREDFHWKTEPNTAFVAYSSMLWKTEAQTPDRISDEAHDSDTLRVTYSSGQPLHYVLNPPTTGLRVQEFGAGRAVAKEWALANEDRDPTHYADFAPALGTTNYNFRSSYRVTLLESNVKTAVRLYENATKVEYYDNIVAASTLRQDIAKAVNADQFVHFKYRTTAFYP